MSATDLLWMAGSGAATLALVVLVWRLKARPKRRKETPFQQWCRERDDFYRRMR